MNENENKFDFPQIDYSSLYPKYFHVSEDETEFIEYMEKRQEIEKLEKALENFE